MAAELLSDDAKEVQRIGMVGFRGENLAVERLGLTEPPGLVVLKGLREGLLDRKRGHGGHSVWKEDTRPGGNAISSRDSVVRFAWFYEKKPARILLVGGSTAAVNLRAVKTANPP